MIDIFKSEDNWQDIKDTTLNTVGLTKGSYPTSEWKLKLLISEHSPIRLKKIYWRWKGIKSWTSVHFCRHKVGVEHWISTQRTDRTGKNRDEARQDSPVNHACEADAQACITMSRKRLCYCASKETREAWMEVRDKVDNADTELNLCMVPECVYRCGCPEMFPCKEGFWGKFVAYVKECGDVFKLFWGTSKSCFLICRHAIIMATKKTNGGGNKDELEPGFKSVFRNQGSVCLEVW